MRKRNTRVSLRQNCLSAPSCDPISLTQAEIRNGDGVRQGFYPLVPEHQRHIGSVSSFHSLNSALSKSQIAVPWQRILHALL